MADVGVLNLQIHDNSEQAVQGLDKLTDALARVKTAVSGGLKLGKIATDLERIGKVVDDSIHGSTIAKISQLGEALSQLKGLDNVRITIKDGGNSVQIRDALGNSAQLIDTISQTSQTMASEMTEDFGQAAAGVRQATEAYEDMKDRMAEAKGAGNGLDFSVFDPSKLPLDALGMKIDESGQQWRQYGEMVKDSFDTIKNAGVLDTVTSSVEEVGRSTMAIIPYNENLENSWERISARMDEAKQKAAEYEAIRKEQEAKFYAEPEKKEYTMAQTNAMADNLTQLDLLKAKLREAEEQYNKFVNTLGTDSAKTVAAGLKVSDLRDKIWEYNDALKQANATATTSGLDKVTEYMDASKIDLLTEKYNAMQTALAQDIQNGKADTQQAIDRAIQIRNLGNQIEELKQKEEDASESTHRLRNAFESFRSGIKNLGITKLLGQFARIAKYRFLRAVIRQITSAFSEGVQNVYNYSKAIGSSFAPSMDAAATSLQQMKNSIGAAIAPVIQALVPVLQTVVNWFITAINYVNQFLSLLRGQATWTRALPATTTAFGEQEKAAKKAGAAIKDLLADWDELNIIQSQTGGGGGLGSASTAEDYLNMFEEVGVFDSKVKKIVEFIKDNMDRIKDIAVGIGAAILGWKLSHAFSGALGTLGNLILGGALIDIGLNLSYASGFQAGLEGEWSAETLLGAVAGGIASAIGGSVIGYALACPGGAVVGAIIGATLALAATIVAYKKGSATAAAKAAFADTGEGGINPQDYIDALQAELDSRTKGAKLILDAYVEVPGLKQSLKDAVTEIVSFNTIIFGGDGELTEEDAAAFEENWTKVLNTLNSMSKATYDTLLGGVISALKSDNEELRKQAEEARVSLIMARDQVSEARAKWTKDTEDLKDKIKSGEYSEEDLEEYKRRLAYAAKMSGAEISYVDGVQSMLDRYDVINFGDKGTALDNAKEFITNVGESVHDALDTIAEAKKTIESAKDDAIREVEELYTGGYLTDDEYSGQIAAIEAAYEVDLKFLTDSESDVKSKLQDAYDIVFKQLGEAADKLTGDNRKIYLRDIVGPMMEYAEQQGYKYSKEFQDKYGEEISKNQARSQMLEEYKSGEDVPWYVKLADKTIFSGNENGLFGVMEDLSDILGFDMAYENARGQRVEDIQRYEEEFAQGLKDEIEQTKQAIKTELENGTSLDELYSKYQEDLYGENMHDYIAETFNELNQDEIRSVADQIKDLVQNHDMSFGEARNSVEASADIIEKAFDLAYQELENMSGINQFLLHSVQNQMETYGLSLDKALEMFSDPVYGYTADEIDKVREVLGGVGEATRAAEEAKEDLESAIEGMGEMDIGKAWFDWSNKIHINLPDDISSGARHYVDMIANAINSGKGLEEIQAANDQALEMFGVDAFIEALPYIQELTEKWKTMNGTLDNLDTEGIQNETNSAAASYEGMASRIRAAFQSLDGIGFSINMDGANGNITVTLPPIQQAATGAFVRSGDLVMANENGNFEMMGRMGNQPVIANNQQIVEGITNGVSSANGDVVSELRGLSGLMRQMLNNGMVAKVVPSSTMGRNNARSQEAWERVNG